MPTNTTRGGFRKIALADAADISLVTGDLGDDIDAKILLWAAGTDALKPAAALDGKVYHSTDIDRLAYDMGVSWRKFFLQTADGRYTADNDVSIKNDAGHLYFGVASDASIRRSAAGELTASIIRKPASTVDSHSTAIQVITTGGGSTECHCDGSLFNTDGYTFSGYRIVVPRDGYYRVMGSVLWPTGGGGTTRQCAIGHYTSGGVFVDYIAQGDAPPSGAFQVQSNCETIRHFTTGEQLDLVCLQDSGGNLTIPVAGSRIIAELLGT